MSHSSSHLIAKFFKSENKAFHLIEADKIMFHEGKDRKYKGIERPFISSMNLNLRDSRGP
jgi:hypothetical protein